MKVFDVKTREKVSHAIGEAGNNFAYNLFNTFLLLFYTDCMLLDAGFLSLLYLVSRLIVALSDPIVGFLSDRTESRYGHYRPWIAIASPIIAVSLILCFYLPHLSGGALYLYSFVTFIVLGVSFTAADVPFWTLPSVMSDDRGERESIFALSGLVATIFGGLANFLVPLLVLCFSSAVRGYFIIALATACFILITYYICVITVKERVGITKRSSSLSFTLRSIISNRPLLIIILGGLIVNIGSFMRSSSSAYYGLYLLGGYRAVSLLALMLLFGRIIGSALVPYLLRRVGNRTAIILFLSYGVLSSIVFFFTGYSRQSLVMAMTLLSSISNGAFSVLFMTAVSQTIDYQEYRYGVRSDGAITSLRSFSTKIGSAISGSLIALYLSLIGYVPNATQPQSTCFMIHIIFSLVPALFYLLGIVIFLFDPLSRARTAEIEAELKRRREGAL